MKMKKYTSIYLALCFMLLSSACELSQPTDIEEAVIGTWVVAIPETLESVKTLPQFQDKDFFESKKAKLERFAKRVTLSINHDYIGIVNGSIARRTSYKVLSIYREIMRVETNMDGAEKVLDIELSDDLLKVSFARLDQLLWKRSDEAKSALTEAYYSLPQKDSSGNQPSDIIEKIFDLVAEGELASIEQYLSDDYKKQLAHGATLLENIEALFDVITWKGKQSFTGISKVHYLVGTDDVWNVYFKLMRNNGVAVEDWLRLKLVDGQWKLISRYDWQDTQWR